MAINRFGEDESPWDAEDDSPSTAQLDLDDGDEQLPWLESDEDYEEQPVDTTRVAAFALIGLVVIGLIVGGIWWVTNERSDSAMLADGSTIEAPDEPYKTKPENPGGKTFEGTGDTSFAVAEGQTREAQLAEVPVAEPSAEATQASKPAASGSVGVQVGAYSTRSSAESGWRELVRRFSDLSGLDHRVVEGQADIGRVYRLQALASDVASANQLCNNLRAAGGACQVKR